MNVRRFIKGQRGGLSSMVAVFGALLVMGTLGIVAVSWQGIAGKSARDLKDLSLDRWQARSALAFALYELKQDLSSTNINARQITYNSSTPDAVNDPNGDGQPIDLLMTLKNEPVTAVISPSSVIVPNKAGFTAAVNIVLKDALSGGSMVPAGAVQWSWEQDGSNPLPPDGLAGCPDSSGVFPAVNLAGTFYCRLRGYYYTTGQEHPFALADRPVLTIVSLAPKKTGGVCNFPDVSIYPDAATLIVGSTQQFKAIAVNQCSNANNATQITAASDWSSTFGGSFDTATQILTAESSTAASGVVTASAGSSSAQSNVTVGYPLRNIELRIGNAPYVYGRVEVNSSVSLKGYTYP